MEWVIPQNRQILARQLGQSIHLFQVSGSGQTPDLHDEYDRRLQPPATEGDKVKDSISFGLQSAKNAVSGDDGYHEEMDRPPPGLGSDSFTARDLFRGTLILIIN